MATPENRADIRNLVRARLSAWVDDQGALGAAVSSTTASSLTLAASLDISEKALLQIDDEVIRVRTYAAAGTSVASVIRGDRGTAAATHSNGATVKVFPFWGWTDFCINREIDLALDWLWPDVWILTPTGITLAADSFTYTPAATVVYPNGEQIKRLEILDTSVTPNVYREILGWWHIGNTLRLVKAPSGAKTARIWTQAKHARLTSDAAQLVNSDPVEAIVYYASSNLLEQLLANRVRYVEYSAALNDRASTPDELQRQSYYFKNQAVVAKDRISRPPLSGLASTRRTG